MSADAAPLLGAVLDEKNAQLAFEIALSGDDTFHTANGRNVIGGFLGNDTVWGNADKDFIYGFAGNDLLMGEEGDDYIQGDDGDDILLGGDGLDELDGGIGNDTIFGGNGSDGLSGGAGNDFLFGSAFDSFDTHADEVYRLYQATLDRLPDRDGLFGWLDKLAHGTGFAEVVQGFVQSAEFQAAYGTLDDTSFVSLLYNNVLAREPDEEGLNGWMAVLGAGESRASVVEGFSQSQEFISQATQPLVAWMRPDISTS